MLPSMLAEEKIRSARPLLTRFRLGRSRLAWIAATTVAVIALFFAYLFESRTQGVNSDAASVVLIGWDMTHGNPLLHGWLLADVSFWTFEAPIDGVVGLLTGLHPDIAHITAAFVYTLLVVTVALVAKGTASGREGITRALLAAGVVVAPAFFASARVLLLAPDHIGVAVPVLVTWLLIDRAGPRPWVPPMVCGLLIWAQLDDPVASIAGALPLAVVCAARAMAGTVGLVWVRWRKRRRFDWVPRPRSVAAVPGYDAALAVAAVSSYVLTSLIVSAIRADGGFQLRPIPGGYNLVPWAQVPQNLQWTGQNLLYLFGGTTWGQPTWLGILHWAGLGIALAGLLAGIASLFRLQYGDRVTQTLAVDILAMLAAGALSHLMLPMSGAHEIAVVLPFGAVLGGRTVGGWLARDAKSRTRRVAVAVLTPALALVGVGLLAQLGYDAARPQRPPETQALADFLVAHGLTSGLAGYWQSASTTVDSGGLVHIAAVNSGGGYGYAWESKSDWYDPAVSTANFVVTTSFPPSASGYARPDSVLRWYGQPQLVYQAGYYTIMVYDYNLLTRVVNPGVPALAPPFIPGSHAR
jgi:hypothetical protein